MTISPKSHTTHLIKKGKLTGDTTSFHFEKPKGFDFKPGQYNRWTFDIENPDERGSSRLLTIAASPLEDHISITTRIIQSSFKIKLASLSPLEEVSFFGPMGNFFLDEEDFRPKVFLSGGIGITPFYSMIKYAYQKKLKHEMILLASFSNKSEAIYFDELKNIANERSNIRIIYTLSKKKASGFEEGRISEDMVKKYANISESVFHIVGPPIMVSAMEELVGGMGVSEDRIKIENFTGY